MNSTVLKTNETATIVPPWDFESSIFDILPILASSCLLLPMSYFVCRYMVHICFCGMFFAKCSSPVLPFDCKLSLFRMPFKTRGWPGGAMVLGKLPVPGASYNFDYSRARAYCVCSRCGWGWFGHFYSHLSFLLFLPLFGRRLDID